MSKKEEQQQRIDFLKHLNQINAPYKKTIESLKIDFEIPDPISDFSQSMKDCFKPLTSISKTFNQLERDKKAVEGNMWYNAVLSELETKEYQIKQLKEQQQAQTETIKKINKLTTIQTPVNPKQPPKNKHLYILDIDVSLYYFKTVLQPLINRLFVDSKAYKWECILNGEQPPDPIRTAPETTLKQVYLFFDKLREWGIIRKQFTTILTNTKGIHKDGKPITKAQFKNARDTIGDNYSGKDMLVIDFFDDEQLKNKII